MHNPPGLWSGRFALLLVNRIQNGRKKLEKNLNFVAFHAAEGSLPAAQIAQNFLGLKNVGEHLERVSCSMYALTASSTLHELY